MRFSSTIFIIASMVASLLSSCSGGRAVRLSEALSRDSIEYATGFSISRHAQFTEVNVLDPWDSTRLLQRYLLIDRNLKALPEGMGEGTVVRIPIENLALYTSVHASIVELLHQEDRVAGLCEVRYIDSKILKRRVEEGTVSDLGEATAPNIEKIMDLECEAIISSPFKDAGYGPAEKLGIPIIEGADYMENHPLGRVEWIKFYGMLLGAEELADSIYINTCREYNALKELTADVAHRPTMISERRYGGQWFVPGGKSYNAVMYADAGADYIFKYTAESGSTPLAFESVLDRGIHADIWIFKYYNDKDMTYSDLKAEYEPYANFDAFKSRNIFVCNSSKRAYYEDAPMHPHLILKDYIYIFHPELLPEYQPLYFERLSE
ncbi:MAG: ABC transporter substrate-binding protein [Rikenellaceae bacterium]